MPKSRVHDVLSGAPAAITLSLANNLRSTILCYFLHTHISNGVVPELAAAALCLALLMEDFPFDTLKEKGRGRPPDCQLRVMKRHRMA